MTTGQVGKASVANVVRSISRPVLRNETSTVRKPLRGKIPNQTFHRARESRKKRAIRTFPQP